MHIHQTKNNQQSTNKLYTLYKVAKEAKLRECSQVECKIIRNFSLADVPFLNNNVITKA